MNIGNQILNIRKENQLTQEEFGKLFHVTRQTVSNWENGKSYPELQILVSISNHHITLHIKLRKDSLTCAFLQYYIRYICTYLQNNACTGLKNPAQALLRL